MFPTNRAASPSNTVGHTGAISVTPVSLKPAELRYELIERVNPGFQPPPAGRR